MKLYILLFANNADFTQMELMEMENCKIQGVKKPVHGVCCLWEL